MPYSKPVTFEEAHDHLVTLLTELPHGKRKEIADAVGVTPGYITHILKRRKTPTNELLTAILGELGIMPNIQFLDAKTRKVVKP